MLQKRCSSYNVEPQHTVAFCLPLLSTPSVWALNQTYLSLRPALLNPSRLRLQP